MNDLINDLLIIVFLATMYSTLCVFIPLKPFRNRLHAMKWLLATFFAMLALSAIATGFFSRAGIDDPAVVEEVSDGA